MSSPKIENVTEEFQRFLGVQQAQTFSPMDVTADAIARLLERRGNISQLLGLWKEDFRSVLDAWRVTVRIFVSESRCSSSQ